MNVIPPSFTIVQSTPDMIRTLEAAGRICYQSEPDGNSESFILRIINRGHEAVLEHASVSVDIICDRGVTHELVRHRVASYCQESTRYCNYSKGKFGGEITVISPFFFEDRPELFEEWTAAMNIAESAYLSLLDKGATAQEARSVLPNSLKTQIRITANIREWRHIFKLRCANAAHPQMREIMLPILGEFNKNWPCLFNDLAKEFLWEN